MKATERNGEGSVGIIGKNGIRLLDPDVLRVKKSRERVLSVGEFKASSFSMLLNSGGTAEKIFRPEVSFAYLGLFVFLPEDNK